MAKINTRERIARSIGRSSRDVFLRNDFERFGSPTRVTRAISALVAEGRLVRLGYGVYAKAKPSSVTGRPVPRKTLEELVFEAFQRMGVEAGLGSAASAYATGQSQQVPGSLTLVTPGRRVTRRLSLGARTVQYEKSQRRAA